MRRVGSTIVACLLMVLLFPGTAGADVNVGDHKKFFPSSWNGYKVYLSPGHLTYDRRPFPCGKYDTSEWEQAWKSANFARDQLLELGYKVMTPKKWTDVSLGDRVDTAYEYWNQPTKFAYVPVHSNAHGTINCHHSGTWGHGGTQLLYERNNDFYLGRKIYNRLDHLTPGTAHERMVGGFCGIRAITELCSSKALEMPTGYIEVEFHDVAKGANWIPENNGNAGSTIAFGVDCYLAKELSC